jgi:hypothetical protein
VNVCRVSGDQSVCDRARALADWLVFSNDYLVAHRDAKLPYLGWGPETRTGYFQCSNVSGYHADDLWDTATVLRFLLKLSELEPNPLRSPYYLRARKIVGEQLFRVYRLTRDAGDWDRAVKVLHTQLWDVLVHGNLAYTSFMTYVDRAAQDYEAQVAHNERKVAHPAGGGLGCGAKDSSCWNHLGYEGYALYQIQEILRDLPGGVFPVAATREDVGKAIALTMSTWRTSAFGNAMKFDWSGKESATHVTAYNCAQRFSGAVFDSECRAALAHRPVSATVFYSLIPEVLLRAPGIGR